MQSFSKHWSQNNTCHIHMIRRLSTREGSNEMLKIKIQFISSRGMIWKLRIKYESQMLGHMIRCPTFTATWQKCQCNWCQAKNSPLLFLCLSLSSSYIPWDLLMSWPQSKAVTFQTKTLPLGQRSLTLSLNTVFVYKPIISSNTVQRHLSIVRPQNYWI